MKGLTATVFAILKGFHVQKPWETLSSPLGEALGPSGPLFIPNLCLIFESSFESCISVARSFLFSSFVHVHTLIFFPPFIRTFRDSCKFSNVPIRYRWHRENLPKNSCEQPTQWLALFHRGQCMWWCRRACLDWHCLRYLLGKIWYESSSHQR